MLKFKINFLLILYPLVCNSKDQECTLQSSKSPIIFKYFGKTKLPFELHDRDYQCKVRSGDALVLYCPIGVDFRYSDTCFGNNKSYNLLCMDGRWHCDGEVQYQQSRRRLPQDFSYSPITVDCRNLGPFLYESRRTLENCDLHNSYVYGAMSAFEKQVINAVTCYDIKNLALKYISYNGNYQKYDLIAKEESKEFGNIGLDVPIEDFDLYFQFITENRFKNFLLQSNSTSDNLNKPFDYDYATILQNSLLENDLKDFQNMFQIFWWRNLRHGNWKHFQQAYKKYAKTFEHKVYIGTMGQLSMPAMDDLEVQTLTILHNKINITTSAPEVLWFYIKPLKDIQTEKDEVVFVGFNTPFYKTNQKPFCKDICDEIEWLKNTIFLETHLMPSFGLMYCCHAADVTEKLDNFPADKK